VGWEGGGGDNSLETTPPPEGGGGGEKKGFWGGGGGGGGVDHRGLYLLLSVPFNLCVSSIAKYCSMSVMASCQCCVMFRISSASRPLSSRTSTPLSPST